MGVESILALIVLGLRDGARYIGLALLSWRISPHYPGLCEEYLVPMAEIRARWR
jgi:hypothetical protein